MKHRYIFLSFMVSVITSLSFFGFTAISHAQDQNVIGVRIVGAGALNVRSEPLVGNNIIGTVKYGDAVTVIKKDPTGYWCHIEFNNANNAWVYCPFLMHQPKAETTAQQQGLRGAAETQPQAQTQGGNATVNVSALNVRSFPGMGSNVIGHVNRNDAVTVRETDPSGFWCRIDFGNQPNAWVACRYLTRGSGAAGGQVQTGLRGAAETQPQAQTQGGNATVNVSALNVRSFPGMGSNLVGHVNRNDAVTVRETDPSGFWCRIDFGNQPNAWVACRYLTRGPGAAGGQVQTGLRGAAEQPRTGSATVNAGALHVRSFPGMNTNVIGYLYRGNTVNVRETDPSGFWCRIDFGNQPNAWVACKYLSR